MSLSDLWLLYRERVLQLGGILLAVLSVVVVVASEDAQGAYESGRIAGTATRNIVIGLIGGAVSVYLYRRFYLLEDGTGWTEITPSALLIAGVVAFVLALGGGGGNASGSETVAEVLGDSDACLESGSNPVEELPKGTYVQLSARQAARVNPAATSAPAGIRSLVATYVWGRGREAALISVISVGERVLADPDFQAGFRDGQEATGATSAEIDIAGLDALEFRSPNSNETSIAAPVGCHHVSVFARTPVVARTRMEELLGAG